MKLGPPLEERKDNLDPYLEFLELKSHDEAYHDRQHEDLRPKVHKHDHRCKRIFDPVTSAEAAAPIEPTPNQLNQHHSSVLSRVFPPKGRACDAKGVPLPNQRIPFSV